MDHDSEFPFDVCDFEQNSCSENTVYEMQDTVKLHQVAFLYYCTPQPKPQSHSKHKDNDSSFEGKDDVIEASDNHFLLMVSIHSVRSRPRPGVSIRGGCSSSRICKTRRHA